MDSMYLTYDQLAHRFNYWRDIMDSMHLTYDQLAHRFNYHPPNTEEKVDRHQRVRQACLKTADEIVDATGPPTREQSLAITKLEEAMFWANAAIARGEG